MRYMILALFLGGLDIWIANAILINDPLRVQHSNILYIMTGAFWLFMSLIMVLSERYRDRLHDLSVNENKRQRRREYYQRRASRRRKPAFDNE